MSNYQPSEGEVLVLILYVQLLRSAWGHEEDFEWSWDDLLAGESADCSSSSDQEGDGELEARELEVERGGAETAALAVLGPAQLGLVWLVLHSRVAKSDKQIGVTLHCCFPDGMAELDPYGSSEGDESDDSGYDSELEAAGILPGNTQGAVRRPPIYNKEGLLQKLDDFQWTQNATSWLDTLTVVSPPSDAKVDVNDDQARELAFYTQALDSAKMAVVNLVKAGMPWQRPDDYYAEMVKTDDHMQRVKDKLLYEQRQVEGAEERRRQRELKRYAKEVQVEKTKERAQAKKQDIQSIKQWRKQRENSGYADDGAFPVGLEANEAGRGQKRKQSSSPALGERMKDGKGPSKKAKKKNTKYGFGGPTRLRKQNDADSAADMSGFKGPNRASKLKFAGGPKGQKSARPPKPRPGKARRQHAKSKK
eukprot:jgi/Chlat1/1930/Chrsp153S02256